MAIRSIGLRIKEAREAAGWSQEKLATAIGKRTSTIGMIESGDSNPSMDTLFDIAKALNKDPSYFVKILEIGEEEYKANYSLKEKAFLAKNETKPYIRIIMDAEEQGIDPDYLDEVIQTVQRWRKKE